MICRNLLPHHVQSSILKKPPQQKKNIFPKKRKIGAKSTLFPIHLFTAFPVFIRNRTMLLVSLLDPSPLLSLRFRRPSIHRKRIRSHSPAPTLARKHTTIHLTALVHMRPNQPNNINNMGIYIYMNISEEQRLQSTFIHPCSILQRGHRPQRSCVELHANGWMTNACGCFCDPLAGPLCPNNGVWFGRKGVPKLSSQLFLSIYWMINV